MFKRMLSAFGVGGPSVDTVLDSPHATPGQVVTGQVRIQGGSADAEIGQVVLSLVTRVEVERGDHEYSGVSEFLRVVVQQGVRVGAGQLVSIPFQLPIPWETPITAVGGGQLPGMTVGVRTELVIAGAPDKGDLDPVLVHPLPSQDAVLNAFGQLGFSFRSADVEAGRLHGVPQELGFYQEIEFFPPAQFAGAVQQVELTFVASPHELFVILEADKRGGMFSSGGDAFGHFRLSHQEAEVADWASSINGWLSQVAQRGGGMQGYGQHGHHGGHHGRGGMGMGTVVAAGAAGLVGGMVVGEMMDDAFEDFGDFGGE
ncbi:sporulation protein [Lentzea sp. BCCO 10_0061]|uniref:Sporulation protein n=1 Tax=Lentzea sokolovensis TaxID=3095429 RepID=A0ABU4V7X1_9PSEU|nr:sporulation protein [Lentzea sp. BCCO 10_0061]MDX8147896.1 sporulation protein [Lentzea sp. BCCO 10_0061]